MDIKNFVLSYYKNSTNEFHVQKVEKAVEAQKPHTHEYFQIYYIIKGSLVHFVEQDSSILLQGNMFIVPPGILHYIKPNDDTVFYSLSFLPEFVEKQADDNRLVKEFLYDLQAPDGQSIHPKVLIKSENIFYVESILEHVLKEFEEKPMGYEETAKAYCVVLLTILARNYFELMPQESAHTLEGRSFVLHCVRYIEKNYAENLSLTEMIKQSAMSKSKFCALFSQITGHSFHSYLSLCRIKKATEYIKKGYKITSIYGLCGYRDFSSFYRSFKRVMGISPRDYKKANEKIT